MGGAGRGPVTRGLARIKSIHERPGEHNDAAIEEVAFGHLTI